MTDTRKLVQQMREAMQCAKEMGWDADSKHGRALFAAADKWLADVPEVGFGNMEDVEPDRAFLERTLAAMEGVIDVADRKTDEFDALRSCVMDLTLMLYKGIKPAAKDVEPVGEVLNERGEVDWISFVPAAGTSLYTHPQAREPLTGKEMTEGCRSLGVGAFRTLAAAFEAGVRFAEAAHGIKGETK